VNRRVLMVDDEQRILDAARRNLHGQFELSTASSGADALEQLGDGLRVGAPFAVLVSDMNMPVMSGAVLLAKAHQLDPNLVELVLSGQADLASTISAVNDGNLFRFLTKPCDTDDLTRAIEDGLRQYQLVTSEHELLEQTLNGAVEVLTELIATASPLAFRRTARVRVLAEALIEYVPVADRWEFRLASMVSQVGCVGVPEEILAYVSTGRSLSTRSWQMYSGHPQLARAMLTRIPRLERVSAWVGDQATTLAEAAAPDTGIAPALMARNGYPGELVFAAIAAFIAGLEGGITPAKVGHELIATAKFPEPVVEALLGAATQLDVGRVIRQVRVGGLTVGMVLNQDVLATNGTTLLRAGDPVTETLAVRLRHFHGTVGVQEPISVLV